MEFEIGDKAVYPAHGVGLIQNIETMEFEGVDAIVTSDNSPVP